MLAAVSALGDMTVHEVAKQCSHGRKHIEGISFTGQLIALLCVAEVTRL